MKLFRVVIALLSGGLFSLVGLVLVVSYVREAILLRIGDPDQSLLFWYLPLLFIGLMLMGSGIALVVMGRRPMRKEKTPPQG